ASVGGESKWGSSETRGRGAAGLEYRSEGHGAEPQRVGAEDGEPARLARGGDGVGGQAEVVIVRGARQGTVVVVAPRHLAEPVVDAQDHVDVLGFHPFEAGLAEAAGGTVVASQRV